MAGPYRAQAGRRGLIRPILEGMDWFTAPGYWLGRLVFQRALAGVYLFAFVAAALQFRALIGARGMLPVPHYVRYVPFKHAPSLFQLRYSDRLFACCAWAGAGVAAALAAGAGTSFRWARPWGCGRCCGCCTCRS